MLRHSVKFGLIVIAGAALSGCGSFFDDLNAAAAVQDDWNANQPVNPATLPTDYSAACHTYGCGNNAPAGGGTTNGGAPRGGTPGNGCPYGGSSQGGTACPQ